MTPKFPIAQAIVFAAAGFVIVFLLEVLLVTGLGALFNSRVVPRGLGWIVVPFLGGALGWMFGQSVGVDGIARIFERNLRSLQKSFRILVAASALWMIVICLVFLIFDPFGRYRWYDQEWVKFLSILFGPPLVGLVGMFLFSWALKDGSDVK